MKTLQERIDLTIERRKMTERGMAVGIEKNNVQLIALNTHQVFKYSLMCALCHWRYGQDPTPWLRRALVDFLSAYRYLADARKLDDVEIPTDVAQIVAFLINEPNELPQLDPNDTPYADCALDRILVNVFNKRNALTVPTELLKKLGSKKRQALSCKSYNTYFAILQASQKGEDIGPLIIEAELNYKARAKDAFYSGGEQTEGGNADNDAVVDYRLAAILKFVGHQSPSVHAWKWSL